MAEDRQKLLHALCEIAQRAGAEILRHYDGKVEVQRKADDSPVTAADEAANDLIVDALQSLTPDIPVVAEESVARGDIPATAGGAFWLVDPLDGTKEFISRNGEFTVNIALIEGGKPTMGVVLAPAIGELYSGAAGIGAFLATDTEPAMKITARRQAEDGAVVLVSRSHRDKATDEYLASVKVKDERSAGSSLKFCVVAAGEADIYPRMGRTMEWDTAAGHAVLSAAGGRVETLDGDELVYGKPGHENPWFVAFGVKD